MIVCKTNRLILREFKESDAKNLYLLNSDSEVLKYTGDPPFENEDDALNFIRSYDQYQKYGMGRWAIITKEKNQFIGWCGLKFHANTSEVDIGFRIRKAEWNKGYATEAAIACVDYGFKYLNLNKIIGRAMHANYASIRVLEKLGMSNPEEKVFDEHPGLQFSIEKNEFERRRELFRNK